MDANKSDLLQGTLDMLILKVVALGPIHGYAISKRIAQISKDVLQIRQGSLYPALHRLEDRKWLAADWREAESGRAAKFYRLTAAGKKQLEGEERDWERLATAIGLVLKTAQ
jgi:transcriptional regulator